MATLTITTSGAEDTRIAAAVGAAMALGGSANLAQVKTYVVAYITQTVRDQEALAAAKTAGQAAAIAPT